LKQFRDKREVEIQQKQILKAEDNL